MAEIGIKELKSGASRVIDEVSEGRSYVVTKPGRAAAVIYRSRRPRTSFSQTPPSS